QAFHTGTFAGTLSPVFDLSGNILILTGTPGAHSSLDFSSTFVEWSIQHNAIKPWCSNAPMRFSPALTLLNSLMLLLDYRVLVLRDLPTLATPDHHKSANCPCRPMLDSIRGREATSHAH